MSSRQWVEQHDKIKEDDKAQGDHDAKKQNTFEMLNKTYLQSQTPTVGDVKGDMDDIYTSQSVTYSLATYHQSWNGGNKGDSMSSEESFVVW